MLNRFIFATGFIIALSVTASFAMEEFYTLQLGSFRDKATAIKLYNAVLERIDRAFLDKLRIEKVKGYYVVRVGTKKKYEDIVEIERVIKKHYPSSIRLRAYYINERIIKEYRHSSEFDLKESSSKKTVKNKTKEDTISDKSLEVVIEKSLLEHKEGRFDEAYGLIEEALKKWPDSDRLYGLKGTLLLKQEKIDDAIVAFKRAIDISPNRAEYHNGLGYGFLYKKEYISALREFDKALIINPEYVDALAGLGLTYVELGYKDHAMETYRRLREIDEDAAKKLFQIIIMRL